MKQAPTKEQIQEVEAAVKLLKRHNEWRRGAKMEMISVIEVGKAIDTVIDYIEQQNKQTP